RRRPPISTSFPYTTLFRSEKDERERQLDARLARHLLGALAAARAHRVGMRPQRRGDAGSELVGLDQHGDQRVDVLDAGALGQVRSEEHTSELQSLAYLVCR